jgi:hypothetical protein
MNQSMRPASYPKIPVVVLNDMVDKCIFKQFVFDPFYLACFFIEETQAGGSAYPEYPVFILEQAKNAVVG